MVELQIFIDISHSKSDELFSSNIVNGLYVYVVYDKGTCTNFFDYSVFKLFLPRFYNYTCTFVICFKQLVINYVLHLTIG